MAEWLSPQWQEHTALIAHMVADQETERVCATPTSPEVTSSHHPGWAPGTDQSTVSSKSNQRFYEFIGLAYHDE